MADDLSAPMDDGDIIAFTRDAIEASREDTRRSGATGDGTVRDLQPGVTIDLGHRNIQKLPEEVVDIIKGEIERLALAHNQLSSFPASLSQCNRLRYLNVRYNALREFPEPILKLASLEILDISKNRIRALPDAIGNLSSLKVLAIQRNKIEKLPLCLGDISSLQVLKLDGNPLIFPPPEICSLKKDAPAPSNENEKDAVITAQVKRYLKQIQTREKLKVESEGESSEGNVETPRPPRRAMSGRFPVKPSISGLESLMESGSVSPSAPPIPSRSHYRVLSQSSNASRRPGITPLLIGNERNRSQSESVMPSNIRTKRMGIIPRKNSDLEMLDENLTKRLSHYRGFSHGSVISGTSMTNGNSSSSPASLGEIDRHRRPLSDLLEEHKRKSKASDIVVEASRGILYAIVQLHHPMSSLLASTKRKKKEAKAERQELERRFGISRLQTEELSRQIRLFETDVEDEDGNAERPSANDIRNSCAACVEGFILVCQSMYENAIHLVREADARFVRSLLLLLYASMVELRNSCAVLGVEISFATSSLQGAQPAGRPVTPTHMRQPPTRRPRGLSAAQSNGKPGSHHAGPPVSFGINGSSRTNTFNNSGIATTPYSGETFGSLSAPMTRSNTLQSNDDSEEERQFERIFLKLRVSCDMVVDAVPSCRYAFSKARDIAKNGLDARSEYIQNWTMLIDQCEVVVAAARHLNRRLSSIKLKDPVIRSQHDFWQMCRNFVECWSDLAAQVREIAQYGLIMEDVKLAMKPIQKAVKEVSLLITTSPWSGLAVRNPSISVAQPTPSVLSAIPPTNPPFTQSHYPPSSISPVNLYPTHSQPMSHYPYQQPNQYYYPVPNPINTAIPASFTTQQAPLSAASTSSTAGTMNRNTSVPATPLSAALGPAALATVPSGAAGTAVTSAVTTATVQPSAAAPSTLHPSVQTAFFAGNVFERADWLMQQQQQQQQGPQRRLREFPADARRPQD